MDEIRTSLDLISQQLIIIASLGYLVFNVMLILRRNEASVKSSIVRYYVVYSISILLLTLVATGYYLIDPPTKGSFLDVETGRFLASQPSFEFGFVLFCLFLLTNTLTSGLLFYKNKKKQVINLLYGINILVGSLTLIQIVRLIAYNS